MGWPQKVLARVKPQPCWLYSWIQHPVMPVFGAWVIVKVIGVLEVMSTRTQVSSITVTDVGEPAAPLVGMVDEILGHLKVPPGLEYTVNVPWAGPPVGLAAEATVASAAMTRVAVAERNFCSCQMISLMPTLKVDCAFSSE